MAVKHAYSQAEWKRQPSTAEVLFGLELPYRPPKSIIGGYIWRRRVWLESTFALTMLEPWEKVLIAVLMIFLFILAGTALYLYLPHQLSFLRKRATYYLLGQERDDAVSESLLSLLSGLGWNYPAASAVRDL